MKIYARVSDGIVVEVIQPMFDTEGQYIPIELRFHPDFVALLIDVTDLNPTPGPWWTYDGSVFTAPV
jgi:hypothetical protein